MDAPRPTWKQSQSPVRVEQQWMPRSLPGSGSRHQRPVIAWMLFSELQLLGSVQMWSEQLQLIRRDVSNVRPHRTRAIHRCCLLRYTRGVTCVYVCLSVTTCERHKDGWTDRDAVWGRGFKWARWITRQVGARIPSRKRGSLRDISQPIGKYWYR